MTIRQLFRLHKDVELPHGTTRDPLTGTYSVNHQVFPSVMAVCWPNGTPCIPVETYLMDRIEDWSTNGAAGGSLREAASALSALVRYCWEIQREFWDLRDNDFSNFVTSLQKEKHEKHPRKLRRQDTRVGRILQVSISFLKWLNTSGITSRTIVGGPEDMPQIPLEKRKVFDRRSRGYVEVLRYRYTPVPSTPRPKGPIGADARLKLWDAVARLSTNCSSDTRFRNRYPTEADFALEREYMRKRRELLLDLLGATGARPLELAVVSVKDNVHCASTCKIVLMTAKRRSRHVRKVPISRALAIRIELFIEQYRGGIITRQKMRDPTYQDNDRIFVSVSATPISEDTLQREFNRLCHAAGLEDQRACMSMYRHRFITNMVALHLKEFMDKRPGHSRLLMTESDYRSILRKVASVTGHKDITSLEHYIDLAWDELGIFKGVEPTINLLHSLEGSIASLRGLAQGLRKMKGPKRLESIKRIEEELAVLQEATRESQTRSSNKMQ